MRARRHSGGVEERRLPARQSCAGRHYQRSVFKAKRQRQMNPIDRRTFLRGMGAMMALPALERMMPGVAFAASAPAHPVRMAFLFVPNGINMADWTPTATGALTGPLPKTLQSLEEVRSSLNVLTGLAQHNAFALGDGPGDHARSTACWLTGVHARKTNGSDIRNGPSIDQVAALRMGNLTRF
ncbi:DUF1552 domain-containing protein, partial [bacterium]